jgi:thiamine biosynthesis protein ThiI
MIPSVHIVVHYHELWLKGGNRSFFLHQLRQAMRRALGDIAIAHISRPGDRLILELGDAASLEEALSRLQRVFGISYMGVARVIDRDALAKSEAAGDRLAPIRAAAWQEIRTERFSTFAVRATRSDKSFPMNALELEREIGGNLFDKLVLEGREARVDLKHPSLTCHLEVTRGSVLVYARRIPGAGGLPANTAGKLLCLLSGGFDSAVAAYKMMKRGAHLSFVHFWGGGGKAGESSVHTARELVARLVPWQFTARLYLVPFEPLQREIAAITGSEAFRILLYRRLMLRIAERIALRGASKGLVTGDSLGQVASQTLLNMQAVGSVARLPVYRPLVGEDKLEIQEMARRIGTHDISAESFHDCCPMFAPKSPVLHATPETLDDQETRFDVGALVERGLASLTLERFRYEMGEVHRIQRAARTAEIHSAHTIAGHRAAV